MKFLALLFPLLLSAQHITYSPDSSQNIYAVAWHITACSTSSSTVNLPSGLLFQHLVMHGANPLNNAESLRAFDTAPSRSLAGRIVEYAGWAAVGAGVLMTTDQIKVSQQVKVAVSLGGSFVSVLVPIVRQRIPQISPLRDSLISTGLLVPAGGCAQGVMLGQDGVHFEVTL